ncbi:MAG: hypothetical protein KBA46_07155 [Candidatus Omnitrophica bacterium]|nr:hypothetical protein [Candidatus Omnitrophota bacterium]
MEKKAFLKNKSNDQELDAAPAIPGLSGKAFSIIKLLLGIGLFPFVYSVTISLLNEFVVVPKYEQKFFWLGVAMFLVLYLFVWRPVIVYQKGQQLMEILFSFVKPLVKVAPFLVPIYSVVLTIAYGVAMLLNKTQELNVTSYFVCLFGFSIALHLVFSADAMRDKQGDFLKANYIFGFSFVYIFCILVTGFFVNLTFESFSASVFLTNSYLTARDIFASILKQLFSL